jgi:arylsulfatase A-like enzyme
VVPPKGAPNVLLIMTDNVGFGSPSTFGGIIPTPNLDSIAKIEFDLAYEGQGLEPR